MSETASSRLRRLATPAISLRADLILWLGVLRYFRGGSLLSCVLFVVVGLTLLTLVTVTGAPAGQRSPGPRVGRWVIQGLLVAEAVLLTGFPHSPFTLQIFVLLELALLAVALSYAPRLRREARTLQRQGLTTMGAYAAAFGAYLPPELRRLAVAEFTILETAGRFLLRKPAAQPDDVLLPYGRSSRILLYVLLPTSLVELAVVDYLLRHTPLRWPVLLLGVLSVPYLLGVVAVSRVYPHLLRADRLVLRSGADFSTEIPLTLIAMWSAGFRLDSGRRRVTEGRLSLPSDGQTDFRLELRGSLVTALGDCVSVDIALDPEAVIRLREELISRGI